MNKSSNHQDFPCLQRNLDDHSPREDAREAAVGEARLDVERVRRKGFPEVVLAEGKRVEDLVPLLRRLSEEGEPALASRVTERQAEVLRKEFGTEGVWFAEARVFLANRAATPEHPYPTPMGILTAGLSDRPVAEEAAQIPSSTNYPLVRIYDVGVAGLHRLLAQREAIEKCEVMIVVAGMDGALPAVVAGLFQQPVIAVPTSVGYGVCQNGLTALHTMLASCAPGLAVVNIDNGYGAAMMAHAICLRVHRGQRCVACA